MLWYPFVALFFKTEQCRQQTSADPVAVPIDYKCHQITCWNLFISSESSYMMQCMLLSEIKLGWALTSLFSERQCTRSRSLVWKHRLKLNKAAHGINWDSSVMCASVVCTVQSLENDSGTQRRRQGGCLGVKTSPLRLRRKLFRYIEKNWIQCQKEKFWTWLKIGHD